MATHGQNDDVRIERTLRLLPPRVAEAIRHSSDQRALRSFACACAHRALLESGIEDPLLQSALRLAGSSTVSESDQVVHLRREVMKRVEQLDDLAFRTQENWERGFASREEYLSAFRAARAATSALYALEHPAVNAAAQACYEAFHAMDESRAEDTLLAIVKREL